MTEIACNTPTVSRYWGELKNISDEDKISLIALLSNSMVQNAAKGKEDSDWIDDFVGVWKDSRSADEIVADIHAARTTNHFDVDL